MKSTAVFRSLNLIFKIALALFILTGVGQTLLLSKNAADVIDTFFYFTIQSNLILCGVSVAGAVRVMRRKPESRFSVIVRNGSTIWILLTGLVYHFMLSGTAIAQAHFSYYTVALHYVSPVMAVFNWILFEEKGKSRLGDAVLMLAYPLFYVGLTQVRLAIDGFYPYWFLNPLKPYPEGVGSVWMMLAIVGALAAIFGALGLLLILFDKLMGKRAERKAAGH